MHRLGRGHRRSRAHDDRDGPRPSQACARRSPVPEHACPTRHRPREAFANPGAPRHRRSFGWSRIICSAGRPTTTSDSRARTARDAPWSRRWPTSSLPAACSITGSGVSAATRARTSVYSRSRADAGTAARSVTPSGWQSGPSRWTPRSSRPCRTGRSCSPSPGGSAPTVSTADACSARSPGPHRHRRHPGVFDKDQTKGMLP